MFEVENGAIILMHDGRNLAAGGYDDYTKNLRCQLNEFYPLPESFFLDTNSNRVYHCYREKGLLMTYTALDNAYRIGVFEPREAPYCSRKWLSILAGVEGGIIFPSYPTPSGKL